MKRFYCHYFDILSKYFRVKKCTAHFIVTKTRFWHFCCSYLVPHHPHWLHYSSLYVFFSISNPSCIVHQTFDAQQLCTHAVVPAGFTSPFWLTICIAPPHTTHATNCLGKVSTIKDWWRALPFPQLSRVSAYHLIPDYFGCWHLNNLYRSRCSQ